MTAIPTTQPIVSDSAKITPKPVYRLMGYTRELSCLLLHDTLQRRRLLPALAGRHLRQAVLQSLSDPDELQTGLAVTNDRSGASVYMPDTKSGKLEPVLQHRAEGPTSIAAQASYAVHVFWDVWDYLAWLHMGGFSDTQHHSVILNDADFLPDVITLLFLQPDVRAIVFFPPAFAAFNPLLAEVMHMLDRHGFAVRSNITLYRNYRSLSHYWQTAPEALALPQAPPELLANLAIPPKRIKRFL